MSRKKKTPDPLRSDRRNGFNAQFSLNSSAQCFPDHFDGNAVVDLLEEAFDDHVHGFFFPDTATLSIEDLFFVDPTCGCSVCAADIIGLNFQTGDTVTAGIGAEHQSVTALVAVCLLSCGINFNHAAPDDSGIIPQNFFVQQVTVSSLLTVVLLSVVADFLAFAGECDAVDFRLSRSSVQIDVLMNVAEAAAETDDGQTLPLGVASY